MPAQVNMYFAIFFQANVFLFQLGAGRRDFFQKQNIPY